MNRKYGMRALGMGVLALMIGVAHAGVDVNSATAGDLDRVDHVSQRLSKSIVAERQQHGPYKDWSDFIKRVSGVDAKAAARLSDAGLLVQGVTYTGSHDGGRSPTATAPPPGPGAVGGQPTAGKDGADTSMSPPTIGAPAPATPARKAATP